MAAAKGEKKLVPLPRRTPELPQKIIHYKYRPVGYSSVTNLFIYVYTCGLRDTKVDLPGATASQSFSSGGWNFSKL